MIYTAYSNNNYSSVPYALVANEIYNIFNIFDSNLFNNINFLVDLINR
jgi:hypothetical protein